MVKTRKKDALVLLAHGSAESSDASRPTWDLVDQLRATGLFASVYASFWREEPSFRQVFPAIEESSAYLVPNFISEGYFTREVLPREWELEGPVTQRDGKILYYCDPVGIHSRMTDLLLNRARALIGNEVSPTETALFLVGHGTALARKSRESVEFQAKRIRELEAGFAEVVDLYLEEEPSVSEWRNLTEVKNAVVLPLFICDGVHTSTDIPELLGIPSESVFEKGVHLVDDRRLFYSRAIGTDPAISDIVLDLIQQFDEEHLDENR